MKVTVRCPGKVILFGEHAAVYGYPSLVTTVSAYTQVVIEGEVEPVIRYEAPSADFHPDNIKLSFFEGVREITDEASDNIASEQIRQKLAQKENVAGRSWFLLLYFYHKIVPLDARFGVRVTATTELWTGAGLGSSASYCCSLALGLLTLCGKDTSIENVNKIAYEGEKVFHGTPSGVDNTICSYGGCCLYNHPHPQSYQLFPVHTTLQLLFVNSNQTRSTRDIVGAVRAAHNDHAATFARIGEITRTAKTLLCEGSDEIGALMTENSNLLHSLPAVEHPLTSRIIEKCREYRVPAKITGAGGGGVVIGLLNNCTDQAGLIRELTKAGFQVLSGLQMGVRGVHIVSEDDV